MGLLDQTEPTGGLLSPVARRRGRRNVRPQSVGLLTAAGNAYRAGEDIADWASENPLDAAALAASPIPVLGGIVGAAADAKAIYEDPSLTNIGLGAIGLLPFVPGGVAGAMKSVGRTENLKSGMDAMKRVMEEQVSVPDAMWRDDVGSITFDYGAIGNRQKDYRGGWGASKIAAKRTEVDNIDGDDFVRRRVPEIIANGKLKEMWGPHSARRAEIEDKTGRVSLSLRRDGSRETWLVTGFEKWED